jgi:transposase
MTVLAETIDAAIGVDTHRDTHTAAVVSSIGAVLATIEVPATAEGYKRLVAFADVHAQPIRCWAVEGTGSFGAGLTTHLTAAGEHVVEVLRPKRPARFGGRKTDEIDAIRAAREALGTEHTIAPRARGDREALRVLMATRSGAVTACTAAINHFKAVIVSAPEELRSELRAQSTDAQILRCSKLRERRCRDTEHRSTVQALRSTARRVLTLQAEAKDLEAEIGRIVRTVAPELLTLAGIGAITAAQILISWSHVGRFRSEAAFAAFAGVAPIPASSGLTTRHRLNRGGDRQLNRAIHHIVLTRLRIDPDTRAYVIRRTAEGKSGREIKRCLKRSVARQLFRTLNNPVSPLEISTEDQHAVA